MKENFAPIKRSISSLQIKFTKYGIVLSIIGILSSFRRKEENREFNVGRLFTWAGSTEFQYNFDIEIDLGQKMRSTQLPHHSE